MIRFNKSEKNVESLDSIEAPNRSGCLEGRCVVQANNQGYKNWYIIAVAVCSLVVAAIGCIGLVHSYGLATLPRWLSLALSYPPRWSMWMMAIGGTALGGGLIAYRACKILNNNESDNDLMMHLEAEINATEELLSIVAQEKPKPQKMPAKHFHTQNLEELNSASVGDYAFIKKGPYQLLVTKDTDRKVSMIVLPSRVEGQYRLVMGGKDNQPLRVSSLRYTAPQLTTMMRFALKPPQGIRVSGLTHEVRKKTGLVIFTTASEKEKKYFLVNSAGALEEMPLLKLEELIQIVMRK